jgi:subtilase family serine protease
MQIRFALRHQAELDQLLADQQNPNSVHFHQWLKTGEFFRRFGPSTSEVKALETWLGSQGFTIKKKTPNSLELQGSVAQAQQAFELKIARFGDGNLYANTSDPVLPQRFVGVIGAILGMDNMVHAVPVTRQSLPAADINQARLSTPDAIIDDIEAFGPSDERTFYDQTVAAGQDGSGDCIAIVGISDFLDSTMTTFTNQFDLPAINYTRETEGSNPGINTGESEAELDLQWAHAAAPGASIVYHLGSNLVSDVTGAVNDNTCGAISISYAFCLPTASLIENTLDPLFKQAAAQGQTVFVSAGDDGAAGLVLSGNTCEAGTTRSVNEMSADPNVTSVGGTEFTPTYSNGNDVGHVIEKVWNDGAGAGGGGASEFFSKPSYQTGSGVPDDGARDVPDIALIASPDSPGVFWGHDVNGTAQISCCIGGTSLAAPLWAGFSRVIAQMSGNTRLGSLNPLIYSLANTQYNTAGFHDVTIGDNNFNGVTGFSAGPGYDQTTGWGTVDFDVFANAAKNWLAANTTPTPTTTPTATATPTAAATATATAMATAIATATPAATVTPTATRTSIPTATTTPKATGTATLTATPTSAATNTATATPTSAVTPTATPTLVPTATTTPKATGTATLTATPTAAPTTTGTATSTASPTMTATLTATPMSAPTATATMTSTATAVASKTATSTTIATPTPTLSATATAFATPTNTATATPIATLTSTATAVQTPTPIPTATRSTVVTSTPTVSATPVMTPTIVSTLTPAATPTPVAEPSGGTLSVPSAVRFPSLGIGMAAAQRTILIANRSASSTLTIDVGTLASPFTVSGAGHFTVLPNKNVPVTIIFSPDFVGTANQTLPIRSGDPKHPFVDVTVSGTVQAGKLSAPGKVALVAKPGSQATKTVTLRNSGMLTGTVQPFDPTSSLTLLGGPVQFTLAPGQMQPITIRFDPSSSGVATGSLAIDTAPPPGTTTIVVTGSMR